MVIISLIEEIILKRTNEKRCIHRQDIKHHPNCFRKGLIKDQKIYTPWFIRDEKNVGYLDIETDGLTVDFSTMLSWSIKKKDGGIAFDFITKKELFDLKFDERIVRSCINEIKKYNIIVTYFGTRFDNSFLRAKALHYNIPFPGFISEVTINKKGQEVYKANVDLYHFDLFYLVKSKLGSLSRKSLENVCDYLGIEGKTPLSKSVWRKARYGDFVSIQSVLEHNRQDTIILEQLHKRLYTFSKWTKNPL